MTVQIISNILLVIATASMLLSTTGVRVSQHWCGEKLVNTTIWGEAEPCSHSTSVIDCPIHGKMTVEKNCCNQKAFTIDASENDYFSSSVILDYVPSVAILSFNLNPELFTSSIHEVIYYLNHSPPLLVDVYKLFETYLI